MKENILREGPIDPTQKMRKALVAACEEECEQFKNVPLEMKDPTPDTIKLMVRAFMAKKQLQSAMDFGKKKVVEVRKEINITPWGRPKGRPRTKTTKLLTMVKENNQLRLAGRGRPKAGQIRVKVEVHYKFIPSPIRWYTYANGKLTVVSE